MPTTRATLTATVDELLEAVDFPDYGPNGLQVEGGEAIHRLATGTTASLATIRAAVAAGADALLVHHGILWGGLQPITGMLAARVRELLAAECNLLAYHLPLDAHPERGNNAWVLRQLEADAGVRPFASFKGREIGLAADLPRAVPADDLVARLRTLFDHEVIHCPGGSGPIRRLGVVTGGGQGALAEAAAAGCDALVTGETSEQTWHEAAELGCHCLACGHHATECRAVHELGAELARRLDLEHHPLSEHNPL